MARHNTIAKVGKHVVSFDAQGCCEEPDNQLLTVKEAAAILRCSKSALNKWRGNGNGPRFTYVGNRIRYRLSEIAAFLDHRTRASTSAKAPSVIAESAA